MNTCDRCGKAASLQRVTVLGDYHGRGMWSMWIEQLCPTCAERVRRENRRREEVRRESTT